MLGVIWNMLRWTITPSTMHCTMFWGNSSDTRNILVHDVPFSIVKNLETATAINTVSSFTKANHDVG